MAISLAEPRAVPLRANYEAQVAQSPVNYRTPTSPLHHATYSCQALTVLLLSRNSSVLVLVFGQNMPIPGGFLFIYKN